jgi:predicted N-acetyltransferase YhbS
MRITIRSIGEADLTAADQVFRQSFSTFLGIPDPQTFTGDAAIVATRWRANSTAALGAYDEGTLVGSIFATLWGSFAFLGPVTVRPDFWDKGVAKQLIERMVALFDRSSIRQSALFTFPQSPKHIALYQKFDFWPQYLTPVMSKAVQKPANTATYSRFSTLSAVEQSDCLARCREVTGKIFPGLDVSPEIKAIADQRLGETILIHDAEGLAGLAACHIGAGSEAGSGQTFVKFGAIRPGRDEPQLFGCLLNASEDIASERGCRDIVAGINTARHDAYRLMIERGFRTRMEGLAMLRPNEPGYNRPDCFVIDDLR